MIVNKQSIYYFRLLSDLILLNAAFIISAALAQSFDTLLARNYMFILMMGLNFIWYFTSTVINFYDDFVTRLFAYQIINIIKNVIVQALASIIFIFIVKEDLFTRNFIVYYSILLFTFVSLRSLTFRIIMKKLRERGKNVRSLLIIGTGEVAKNFQKLIEDNPDFGYNFAGFLDNIPDGKAIAEINTEPMLAGSISQLEEIILSEKIEEVVIALKEYDPHLLDNIIRVCNRNAVRIHIIPDYFRFVSKKFRVSMIENFPIITSRNEPLDEIQWKFVKRTFDIIFSLLVIVFLLSYLIPIIAILTKLSSRGPVFFVQERIGARNKKFRCYKFRTLRVEKTNGAGFSPVTENDPRVTPIGRFLRKSNMDELPQFINVLKGEMSVVGPRPHAIPYDDKYGQIIEEIKLRHSVKPGITGWAQAHGLRGDVEDEEENRKRTIKRIEYDLWYIENWSFWLDIQIILLTIWRMIKGETKGV
jgi:putative colanic acid biosysnthesis UDP-glucose lipid carrier transferase